MPFSYKPLWKTLIDKGLKKGDLELIAQVSHNIIAKMGRNEPVSLQALERICLALDCGLSDIVVIVSEKGER